MANRCRKARSLDCNSGTRPINARLRKSRPDRSFWRCAIRRSPFRCAGNSVQPRPCGPFIAFALLTQRPAGPWLQRPEELLVIPCSFFQFRAERLNWIGRFRVSHQRYAKPDHVRVIVHGDVFTLDAAVRRAVMIIAEPDARRDRAVTIKLIRTRLAGATIEKTTLHRNIVRRRNAHQTRRLAAVEDGKPIADTHDRTTTDFRAAARRARFERKNRDVPRQNLRARKLDCAPESDFFGAGEK